MKHFPIFLDVEGRDIAVSGGDEAALAKLRLLAKSDARLAVYSAAPHADIRDLAASGKLTLVPRAIEAADLAGKVLVYVANEDANEDRRVVTLARKAGVLVAGHRGPRPGGGGHRNRRRRTSAGARDQGRAGREPASGTWASRQGRKGISPDGEVAALRPTSPDILVGLLFTGRPARL